MTKQPKVPSVMWSKTTHPDDATENLREEVHEIEAALLNDLETKSSVQEEPKPVAVNPAAELAAYSELLSFLKQHAEEGTEISVLSEQEFAAETFEPTPPTGQS